MTATQAPTPGPLSGSESETVFDGEAHDLVQTAQALAIAIERVPDWLMNDNLLTAHCHAEVLIADLPAALHPQPSGETREHGPKCWGKTSASDEMAHCYCGSEDSPMKSCDQATLRFRLERSMREGNCEMR